LSYIPFTRQETTRAIDGVRAFLKWSFEVLRNAIVVAGLFVAASRTGSSGLHLFAQIVLEGLFLYVFLCMLRAFTDLVDLMKIPYPLVAVLVALVVVVVTLEGLTYAMDDLIGLIVSTLPAK
jgi:hypothetical protein